MRVVVVANVKGGTAKTTSAVFLAHAWAEQGHRVLLVDADPQGSALHWSELTEWPFPALGLPVRDLYRRLPGIVGPAHDLVVVDTPPFGEQAGITAGALRAATHVVVPMAPTMIELDRLAPIYTAVEELEALRAQPAGVSVLLTRVVAQAGSTAVIRAQVEQAGRHVLTATIPRRERLAQAYGAPVTATPGPYADAAAELLEALA